MRKLFKLSLALIAGLSILSVLLLSSNLYTYHRLSHETLVAEVYFDPRVSSNNSAGFNPGTEQQWIAHLATGDRCFTNDYLLQGDQWRVDASFIKWKPWANLLGLNALYRLDRLEGRFSDIKEQQRHLPLLHDLSDRSLLELTEVSNALGQLNVFMDAGYGSSVYQDIDPQQIYYLYKTQSGLITRSKPRTVAVSVREMVTIQINKACGEEPGKYQQAVNWLDRKLGQVL